MRFRKEGEHLAEGPWDVLFDPEKRMELNGETPEQMVTPFIFLSAAGLFIVCVMEAHVEKLKESDELKDSSQDSPWDVDEGYASADTYVIVTTVIALAPKAPCTTLFHHNVPTNVTGTLPC